jgi:DinB superfamily
LTGAAVDEYVLRQAPGAVVALHPSVLRARTALHAALAALHSGVSDADMEFAWDWDGQEADVRYGFYRLYELLEVAAADAERAVGADGWGAARAPIAAGTAARWDLHGLLAGLNDTDLDADPGGGEWSVRQTLGHIVGTQRSFSWITAWWIGQNTGAREELPARYPEEEFARWPSDEDDWGGTLAEVAARFDGLMDGGAARLALLDADELAARARWSGLPVTAGFRLWRWSSHIREHTIQVEKTLVMLRRDPTEVDRLLRLISAAYGRLEARVFCVDSAAIERAGPAAGSAASTLDAISVVLDRYGASIPVAALARVPVTEE